MLAVQTRTLTAESRLLYTVEIQASVRAVALSQGPSPQPELLNGRFS
jgi:hypothetical protein